MSSTNFGSKVIFASCVVGTCILYYVGEFFLNGRGHILLLKKQPIREYTYFVFLHYNSWCWYLKKYLYPNGRDGEYSETE